MHGGGGEEVTYHRDHEKDEGEAREPQVPEGAVLQLARALGCRLERDHTAEELGCDCSPARLQTQTILSAKIILACQFWSVMNKHKNDMPQFQLC